MNVESFAIFYVLDAKTNKSEFYYFLFFIFFDYFSLYFSFRMPAMLKYALTSISTIIFCGICHGALANCHFAVLLFIYAAVVIVVVVHCLTLVCFVCICGKMRMWQVHLWHTHTHAHQATERRAAWDPPSIHFSFKCGCQQT